MNLSLQPQRPPHSDIDDSLTWFMANSCQLSCPKQ